MIEEFRNYWSSTHIGEGTTIRKNKLLEGIRDIIWVKLKYPDATFIIKVVKNSHDWMYLVAEVEKKEKEEKEEWKEELCLKCNSLHLKDEKCPPVVIPPPVEEKDGGQFTLCIKCGKETGSPFRAYCLLCTPEEVKREEESQTEGWLRIIKEIDEKEEKMISKKYFIRVGNCWLQSAVEDPHNKHYTYTLSGQFKSAMDVGKNNVKYYGAPLGGEVYCETTTVVLEKMEEKEDENNDSDV